MSESQAQKRKLILEAGSFVVLHPDGPAGGFPMAACVDRVSDGLHWFLGCIDPLRRGDPLIVEYPVPTDARYATHATILACSAETFALKIEPLWDRAQQREFVRISAHGLTVRIVREIPLEARAQNLPDAMSDDALDEMDGDRLPEDEIYPLLDISAGGIRFQTDTEFEAGEELVCHFELPGSECFVLSARTVRARLTSIGAPAKPEVAVEFQGLDESHRSELLRWVYREQVNRHRTEQRSPTPKA